MKVTRPCARCGSPITRYPSRFLTPPERTFCSTICRNRSNLEKIPTDHSSWARPRQSPTRLIRRGEDAPGWKGDEATPETKRRRALRMYPLAACELCGKPGTDRHHRDANTGNNVRSNIQILCRRCHMKVDGRGARLAVAGAPYRRRPSACVEEVRPQ